MPCLKLIVALIALAAWPAGAEEAGLLQAAHLASRLYAEGVAEGDAILVLTAAHLRREAGLPEIGAVGWVAMMAEAEWLAAGDAALLALVSDMRAETTKGVASGPEYQLARLAEGAVQTLPPITFRGGEYAEVYVEGPLGADFNLTVLDDAGLVVCTDKDRSHVAYCGWTPAKDGAFALEIENAGPVAADYALITN